MCCDIHQCSLQSKLDYTTYQLKPENTIILSASDETALPFGITNWLTDTLLDCYN